MALPEARRGESACRVGPCVDTDDVLETGPWIRTVGVPAVASAGQRAQLIGRAPALHGTAVHACAAVVLPQADLRRNRRRDVFPEAHRARTHGAPSARQRKDRDDERARPHCSPELSWERPRSGCSMGRPTGTRRARAHAWSASFARMLLNCLVNPSGQPPPLFRLGCRHDGCRGTRARSTRMLRTKGPNTMKMLLQQAKDIAHGLTIRDGAKRAGWALAGVGAALLTTSATAVAAPPPPGGLVDPATLSDLSVTMSAPTTIYPYRASSLTINVTNAPPNTVYRAGAGTLVRAHMDLTGLIATSAVSDAGLSCTVS